MKTPLNQTRHCPSCGNALGAGILEGLCPACLLASGAATSVGGGGDPFTPPTTDTLRQLFPQLEILELLGTGGMGAVYKARQPSLDRLVALKILPADEHRESRSEERFNREARALARLSHPNIVAVHEFGRAGQLHYFLMEYVDGANLRQLLHHNRLSSREALRIIPQVCDALQYAHDEGVVHRDIKPENVMVDRKGRVKIADFGLARILGAEPESHRLTGEGQVMGTPHYMAPEQLERPLTVDHRADIYALGVVLYEMLTGDLPLGRFPPPSRKVEVDVRFDEVVLRALENDPNRRYQRASEIKTRVEAIAERPQGDPDPGAADGGRSAEIMHTWAGFPVAHGPDGSRRVDWTGSLKLAAIVFGLLTAAFACVTASTGRSLFGWLGVIGWPGVVVRLILSVGLVGTGVWRTVHSTLEADRRRASDGSVLPASQNRRWLRHWKLLVLLPFLIGGGRAIQSGGVVRLQEAGYWPPPAPKQALPEPGTGLESVTLARGGRFQLLQVSRAPRVEDEGPVAGGISDIGGLPDLPSMSNRRLITWDLLFARTGPVWLDREMVLETTPATKLALSTNITWGGRPYVAGWAIRGSWERNTDRVHVRLGHAMGPWRTVERFRVPGGDASRRRLPGYGEPIGDLDRVEQLKGFIRVSLRLPGEAYALTHDTTPFTTLTLGREAPGWRIRVIVKDASGREHTDTAAATGPPGNSPAAPLVWSFDFPGLDLNQNVEAQVQAQPMEWVEFRDLSLPHEPAGASPVWGPERRLTVSGLLDLDTGKVGEFPPAAPGNENPFAGMAKNPAWMQEQGFDLEAGAGVLNLVGMEMVPLDAAAWGTMTATELLARFPADAARPSTLAPDPHAGLPAVAGFRTRERAMGLIRLEAFASNPMRATLAYRLVQSAQNSAPGQ